VVRVSGFSAYFTSLVKQTQDEIIKRTEHAAV
jgi:pyruvate-formate lyase